MTPEEFAARFGPTEQDYEAVIEFARSNGFTVTGTHSNRTLLDVRGSVADIERTFGVTLLRYRHPTEVREFYAPDVEPSLDLTVPVLHIAGLDNYAVPRPLSIHGCADDNDAARATPAGGSGPRGNYMGQDFICAYVPGESLTGVGQVLGLVEFDGYYGSDISKYESQAGLPNVELRNVLVDGFSGTPTETDSVLEVSLDIEMAISIAPGLSTVLVYEAANDGSTATLEDLLNQIATDGLARQISSSWFFGDDPSLDQVYQQFAHQGQSFFQASGDNGAYTDSWPNQQQADSPYITVVGGTTLKTAGKKGRWESETVWNSNNGTGRSATKGASGGGISANYAIPSWQEGIDMTANEGSTVMRNVPDVAMVASDVYVIFNNGLMAVDVEGTSCAAPMWAGFTALVNQQAVANGQPTVGFLNPAIYGVGTGTTYDACFHDVTLRNNETHYSPTRYSAVPGYDLCTGWGSPTGSNLVDALAPASEGVYAPCPVILSEASGTVPAKGGSGTLIVEPRYTDCEWTVASNDPFITVSGQTSGKAKGTIRYTVSPNTNTVPIAGTITIGDQTFTVNQAMGGCTYTLSPKGARFKAEGGSGTVKLNANYSDCTWTAVSNDSFIKVTAGTAGGAKGMISYTVAANSKSTQLVGSITIDSQTFRITVDAAP